MSGWVEPEHFRQLLTLCDGKRGRHYSTSGGGELFRVGNDRVVCGSYTAMLAASQGGSEGLVVELLKRGADWKARGAGGSDALWIASARGHVAVATIRWAKAVTQHQK